MERCRDPRESNWDIDAREPRNGAAALSAAAGFAVALGLARHGHPATAVSSSPRTAPQPTGSSSSPSTEQDSTSDAGTIAPSSGGSLPAA